MCVCVSVCVRECVCASVCVIVLVCVCVCLCVCLCAFVFQINAVLLTAGISFSARERPPASSMNEHTLHEMSV